MESKFGWQRHPSPTAADNTKDNDSSEDDNFEDEEDKNSSHSSEDAIQKLSHLKKDTSKM